MLDTDLDQRTDLDERPGRARADDIAGLGDNDQAIDLTRNRDHTLAASLLGFGREGPLRIGGVNEPGFAERDVSLAPARQGLVDCTVRVIRRPRHSPLAFGLDRCG